LKGIGLHSIAEASHLNTVVVGADIRNKELWIGTRWNHAFGTRVSAGVWTSTVATHV